MHKIEQKGSVVMCFSPLVSLVMDQKAKFVPMGHTTEFVGEDQPDSKGIEMVLRGDVQLVYIISPKSLICSQMYRSMLLSPAYRETCGIGCE